MLSLLAATAWMAGRLVLRRLEGLEGCALSTALGLSLLAHAAFALAALGLLTRSALAVLAAAVHLAGIPVWRRTLGGFRWRWGTALGLLAAVAPVFVLALYPPTGFDETLYHLPFARAFAATGSLPFLPQLRVPVFPPLAELLFAGMLLLAGDVSTHLVQLLAALAAAALLIAWGRRVFSPAAGWLAAAAFLGNPIVVHLSGTGYVEPLLALFVTAAMHALERWRESRETAWLALAALFAGSAAGVKYLGHGLRREGALPVRPAEREAYLRRELPVYAALQHLNRLHGRDYVVYGVQAENMVYHAQGTLLGDWSGPASYGRVLPAMSDPEAFHRRLRELGVGYLLLPRDRAAPLSEGPAWRRRFRRIYADRGAVLYELSPFRPSPGT